MQLRETAKPIRKRPWSALGLGIASVLLAPGAFAEPLDEALYARVLSRHTREVTDTARTRVGYRGLAHSEDWSRLVAGLARADPAALDGRGERIAFWINAYNILTIDLVVRNYPVDSIRDIGSLFRPVWKRRAGTVGGRAYILDHIEHEILRPLAEPRIHAAIVCASISCPALRREPWSAAKLEAQLDDALRRWLADREKGLRIDPTSRTIYLSRVFDWFAEDFESRGGVLAFLAPYMGERDRAWTRRNGDRARIGYLDYDWRLNDLAGAQAS